MRPIPTIWCSLYDSSNMKIPIHNAAIIPADFINNEFNNGLLWFLSSSYIMTPEKIVNNDNKRIQNTSVKVID